MNDFSELEAELKQLRPVAPSSELKSRIERALAEAPAPAWGAQAASLQFAAACRKRLRALRARSTGPFGRLPNGAGWQPALPRRVNWLALGGGVAAAAAFLMLARVDVDKASPQPQRLAATSPGPSVLPNTPPPGLVPDAMTRVLYGTRDEGLMFPEEAARPVRRVRSRSRETLQWKDANTGASLRVSYPTEEVELIPVSGQ